MRRLQQGRRTARTVTMIDNSGINNWICVLRSGLVVQPTITTWMLIYYKYKNLYLEVHRIKSKLYLFRSVYCCSNSNNNKLNCQIFLVSILFDNLSPSKPGLTGTKVYIIKEKLNFVILFNYKKKQNNILNYINCNLHIFAAEYIFNISSGFIVV